MILLPFLASVPITLSSSFRSDRYGQIQYAYIESGILLPSSFLIFTVISAHKIVITNINAHALSMRVMHDEEDELSVEMCFLYQYLWPKQSFLNDLQCVRGLVIARASSLLLYCNGSTLTACIPSRLMSAHHSIGRKIVG